MVKLLIEHQAEFLVQQGIHSDELRPMLQGNQEAAEFLRQCGPIGSDSAASAEAERLQLLIAEMKRIE